MTLEQINHEIAIQVMGWHLVEVAGVMVWQEFFLKFSEEDWNPYHRIDHAWMVVEKLRQIQYFLVLSDNAFGDFWKAKFVNIREVGKDIDAHADTAQMAICLAALEAVK